MFYHNPIRITGTLHIDQYIFLIVSRSVLLRTTNVSDKFVEKLKSHILCSVIFFFLSFENSVYEIMCKNNVESGRPQMTVRRMRIACSMPNGINTHSEYVTLLFPLQQWLQERASVLRYTYIVCLVYFKFVKRFPVVKSQLINVT
jgi:hypothetical protein